MLKIEHKTEFEGNCWVGLVDSSDFNSSEKNRIEAVTDMASITKGKLDFEEGISLKHDTGGITTRHNATTKPLLECFDRLVLKRREALYNRLLKESAGKPSTPFEFVPYVEDRHQDFEFPNSVKKYSTEVGDALYTNLRILEIKKWYPTVLPTQQDIRIQDFKIIVGRVPWKVISHLRTHRAFSWLVSTSRCKGYRKNLEFWIDSSLPSYQQTALRWASKAAFKLSDWLIKKGVKAEIANMFIPDNRIVTFAMAAWKQDANAWDNLFAVRGYKTGTMGITEDTVENIKTLVNYV